MFAPAAVSAETAEDANAEGVAAYRAGDFGGAAAAFRRAWELSENPAARKNEAIAWFKSGDCESALEAGSSFLTYGQGTFAEFIEVNSVIGNCKAKFAREALALGNLELAEKLLGEARYLEVDGYAREQINLADLEFARAFAKTMQVEVGPQKTRNVQRPAWAWGLFGGGLAVLGSAVAYHVAIATTTKPNLQEARDAGRNDERAAQLAQRVKVSNWLLPTLYGVGAAATLTGGYFLFVAPGEDGTVVAGITTSF